MKTLRAMRFYGGIITDEDRSFLIKESIIDVKFSFISGLNDHEWFMFNVEDNYFRCFFLKDDIDYNFDVDDHMYIDIELGDAEYNYLKLRML